jgi:hypothetical protein
MKVDEKDDWKDEKMVDVLGTLWVLMKALPRVE